MVCRHAASTAATGSVDCGLGGGGRVEEQEGVRRNFVLFQTQCCHLRCRRDLRWRCRSAGGSRPAGDRGPGRGHRAVRAVGHEGAGDEAARAGWRQLGRADAGHLIEILSGMDGARAAGHQLLAGRRRRGCPADARQRGQLPADQLERFVLDRRHSPRPRRLAYEWLVKVDPSTPDAAACRGCSTTRASSYAVTRSLRCLPRRTMPRAAKRNGSTRWHSTRHGTWTRSKPRPTALAKFGVTTDLATHLGYIVDWHLIGPFDNTDQKGFQVPYPPEAKVDFDADCDGKRGAGSLATSTIPTTRTVSLT